MAHVDALSRNPLPACLVVDESDGGLTSRLRKAQEEEDNVVKLRDLMAKNKTQDYIV